MTCRRGFHFLTNYCKYQPGLTALDCSNANVTWVKLLFLRNQRTIAKFIPLDFAVNCDVSPFNNRDSSVLSSSGFQQITIHLRMDPSHNFYKVTEASQSSELRQVLLLFHQVRVVSVIKPRISGLKTFAQNVSMPSFPAFLLQQILKVIQDFQTLRFILNERTFKKSKGSAFVKTFPQEDSDHANFGVNFMPKDVCWLNALYNQLRGCELIQAFSR